MADPLKPSTKNLNYSSLTTALNRLRDGVAWMPNDPLDWHSQIRDSLYRDCLAAADGNESHVLPLLLDLMAGTLGEMVWRAGNNRDEIIKWFNTAAARHERSFKLTLSIESHTTASLHVADDQQDQQDDQ